jgi:hypothetical protein
MQIHTYWWGAEMFPENDDEWEMMKSLFSNVNSIGSYENGGDPVDIFDGNTYPFLSKLKKIAPTAYQENITTELRCITIAR